MAKFMGIKQKGMLGNIEIELRDDKSNLIPKIITGDLKKPLENIVNKEIIEYFNETVDQSHITTGGEAFENKKFWMNLINPKKTDYFSIVEKYKRKHKFVETINAILAAIALVMSVIEYELAYFPKFIKDNKTSVVNVEYSGDSYRVLISALCGLMCIFSVYSCYYDFVIKREQKKIVNVGFFNSYYILRLIMELIINFCHPFPYYDFFFDFELLSIKIRYYFQTFFYALMYLKLYHMIRVLTLYTKYKTIQSEKYCDHYGGEADTIFALKSLQKDHPFLILALTLMINIVVCGLLLRMFEILNTQSNGNIDYYYYTNGMWNICVAMTTVGYGDFFPKTHIGRMITVYGIFIGIFLTSLLIVALNKASSFDQAGLCSYILLKRIYYKNELRENSLRLIQNYYRQYLRRKAYFENIKDSIKTTRFKEAAICAIEEKAKHYHEVDQHVMVLKRSYEPINRARKFAKK